MVQFDVGFLGGGQLARMSMQAAQRMGLNCVSLDPDPESPAAGVGASVTGSLNDYEMVAQMLGNCAVVTLENEFIPASVVRHALEEANVNPERLLPSVDVLERVQDKLLQKQALLQHGVPTPKCVAIDGDGELAVAQIGFPMVIKVRFGGYDGKGTLTVRNADEFADQRINWGQGGWMAEELVTFRREAAVMAFRWVTKDGPRAACFPTMETVQHNHVCDLVYPCDHEGAEIAIAAVEALEGIGLFGVELFEIDDRKYLVNEIAPRPHNTGHYTLDWGGVSQFEQHVRLALRLPLVRPVGQPTCMANLLGQPATGEWRRGFVACLEHDPDVRFHWYGKSESRPGRKMGHLNVTGDNIVERAKRARQAFYEAWSAGQPAEPHFLSFDG